MIIFCLCIFVYILIALIVLYTTLVIYARSSRESYLHKTEEFYKEDAIGFATMYAIGWPLFAILVPVIYSAEYSIHTNIFNG